MIKSQVIKHSFLYHWREYLELCKPKVVALMVFTAVVGMLLAAPGAVPVSNFIFGILGIALVAASAAAINHVADSRIDAAMLRTQHRPLPTGSLEKSQVLGFAGFIGVLGMSILVFQVNVLTAILTFASLIGYAVVYTMYLKRATPQNIVIGGAAGATPPLLGWTAVTGSVDAGAIWLFLIIFVWTPPHFWALAIYRKDEYAKVDIPMLPVTHGDDYTRLQITFYTVLLFIVTHMPYLTGMSSYIYLVTSILSGVVFLYFSIALQITKSRQKAIETFVYSIVYLMVLFAGLLADRYIPLLMSATPV
jgi:protoheme IX farnesyltransferase